MIAALILVPMTTAAMFVPARDGRRVVSMALTSVATILMHLACFLVALGEVLETIPGEVLKRRRELVARHTEAQ